MTQSAPVGSPQERYFSFMRAWHDAKHSWAVNGNCLALVPGAMIPTTAKDQEYLSKKYCTNCSVKTECLFTALVGFEAYGVWGGTTEEQRKPLLEKVKANVDITKSWSEKDKQVVYNIAASACQVSDELTSEIK